MFTYVDKLKYEREERKKGGGGGVKRANFDSIVKSQFGIMRCV